MVVISLVVFLLLACFFKLSDFGINKTSFPLPNEHKTHFRWGTCPFSPCNISAQTNLFTQLSWHFRFWSLFFSSLGLLFILQDFHNIASWNFQWRRWWQMTWTYKVHYRVALLNAATLAIATNNFTYSHLDTSRDCRIYGFEGYKIGEIVSCKGTCKGVASKAFLEDGKHWNKFVNHFSFFIVPH